MNDNNYKEAIREMSTHDLILTANAGAHHVYFMLDGFDQNNKEMLSIFDCSLLTIMDLLTELETRGDYAENPINLILGGSLKKILYDIMEKLPQKIDLPVEIIEKVTQYLANEDNGKV